MSLIGLRGATIAAFLGLAFGQPSHIPPAATGQAGHKHGAPPSTAVSTAPACAPSSFASRLRTGKQPTAQVTEKDGSVSIVTRADARWSKVAVPKQHRLAGVVSEDGQDAVEIRLTVRGNEVQQVKLRSTRRQGAWVCLTLVPDP